MIWKNSLPGKKSGRNNRLPLLYKPEMQNTEQAKRLLNESHKWPSLFAFKFIVPAEQAVALRALLPKPEKEESRPSSGGKYTALTFHIAMGSADEVLGIYSLAKAIPGLIAL